MHKSQPNQRCLLGKVALLCAVASAAFGQERPTFDELKTLGAERSSYRKQQTREIQTKTPQPRLAEFRQNVQPILTKHCVRCHGPKTQEGNIRIDTLDPDLLHGEDVNWWLEVSAVLTAGEMPPAEEAKLKIEQLEGRS